MSLRVVADHLRATTFLIADGILPGNEGRGYVLRKIVRRGLRHGKKLGIEGLFFAELTSAVVARMSGAFPELLTQAATVTRVVRGEEERFTSTLKVALAEFEKAVSASASSPLTLSGAAAFKLYDTYGLPLDFLEELASDRGLAVDHQASIARWKRSVSVPASPARWERSRAIPST